MTLTSDWAAVYVAIAALSFSILGWLLNSIRVILSGIRLDIKEMMLRQHDSESRITVLEELVKRLKCQRCENG